jgi:TonB family protein
METLTPPDSASHSTEPELHLLADVNGGAALWLNWRAAAMGSVAFHFLAILLLLTVKTGPPRARRPERVVSRRVTPLFIPRDLTQKAPNKEPVSKELTIASIVPRPAIKVPSPAPAAKQAPVAAPQAAPPPPKPAPIEPPKIEPPRIEAAVPDLPVAQLPKAAPMPPPPGNAPPKLALEDVQAAPRNTGTGKPTGLIAMPGTSVADAVRALTHSGAVGGVSIGDDEGGIGAGLNLPPSAGRPRSNLELKSDPMGVDFRAYMTQVLAAVRRNWFAVYPEAARLGQRGQVVLVFSIAKQGLVTKVVFNGQSGAKALDQSAVAAISASNPLPPLPTEFKGDHIALQMTFSYNMPR